MLWLAGGGPSLEVPLAHMIHEGFYCNRRYALRRLAVQARANEEWLPNRAHPV